MYFEDLGFKVVVTLGVLLSALLVGYMVWDHSHPCKIRKKSETCYVYNGNVAVPFECGECLERE